MRKTAVTVQSGNTRQEKKTKRALCLRGVQMKLQTLADKFLQKPLNELTTDESHTSPKTQPPSSLRTV